jgi:Flp pilus assembly pilin Flp
MSKLKSDQEMADTLRNFFKDPAADDVPTTGKKNSLDPTLLEYGLLVGLVIIVLLVAFPMMMNLMSHVASTLNVPDPTSLPGR